jgi:uncharacterized membrane protein
MKHKVWIGYIILVRLIIACFLVGGVVYLFLPYPANAATIHVSCDTESLIRAIDQANALGGQSKLELSSNCIYRLNTTHNAGSDNEYNGLPVINSNITINGKNATIIRDASAPRFRLLEVAAGANLTVNDLTLSQGLVTNAGGAIYSNGSVISLNNCTLNNNSGGCGGAIDLLSGTLTAVQTSFTGNVASV